MNTRPLNILRTLLSVLFLVFGNSIVYGQSTEIISYTRTIVNTAIYNAKNDDDIVAVQYTPTGPVTIILPEITQKAQINIVDEGGSANVNNITIVPNGTNTILNQSSFSIVNAYNGITIYNDEISNWFIR